MLKTIYIQVSKPIFSILFICCILFSNPIFSQTIERKDNKYTNTLGYALNFGQYQTNNDKISSVFGKIPMFHFNIYGERGKNSIAVLHLSYGVKRSLEDRIYLEYAGSNTNNLPNYNFFKNIMATVFNFDVDFLYIPYQVNSLRFLFGPGMNLAFIGVKGDEMEGVAGGQIYGGEISDNDTGGGLGLEVVTGFQIFYKKYFIQLLGKYQTKGIWWNRYLELPEYIEKTEMGTFDVSGFQLLIGFGIHN